MVWSKFWSWIQDHESLNDNGGHRAARAAKKIVQEIQKTESENLKEGISEKYWIHTLPTGGMYWVVHPQWPRDFLRPEGSLEVGGDVQPNAPRLMAVYGHSLIIYPSQGMYQEIPLYRTIVRINTSLVTMRDWLSRCVNIHRTVWGYFLIFTASVWTNEKNWIKPFPQSISSYVFCLLPFCPQLHKTVYRCKSATLLACNVSFKVLTKAWPSWEKPLKSFVNSDQTWWDSGKSRAYKSWSIMM